MKKKKKKALAHQDDQNSHRNSQDYWEEATHGQNVWPSTSKKKNTGHAQWSRENSPEETDLQSRHHAEDRVLYFPPGKESLVASALQKVQAQTVQREKVSGKGKGAQDGKAMQPSKEKQEKTKKTQSKAARHPAASAVIAGLRSRRQASKGKTKGHDAQKCEGEATDTSTRRQVYRALQYFILRRPENMTCKDRINQWENMSRAEKDAFTRSTKQERGL